MGKAGRFGCIILPIVLTIASLICIILIEVAGWNTLESYYYFRADLTNIQAEGDNSALSHAIGEIKTAGGITDIYNVYLWNYCYSNSSDGSDLKCTGRESRFVFDPIDIWGLNTTGAVNASASDSNNAISDAINNIKENYDELEDDLLGSSGRKALNAYRKVASWNWVAIQIALATTIATLLFGILAVFSRWGSLLTWVMSLASSIFTFGSVLTSTVLFSVLVGALKEVLEPYNITLQLGRNALVAGWLGVAFSVGATLFWLFSICCCSGRSNPHHKNNKGGLWNSEPQGQGYGDHGRGRGLKVEKTGGGYERVASPFLGGHDHGDQVPLHDYQQPAPYSAHHQQPAAGFEPYRHN